MKDMTILHNGIIYLDGLKLFPKFSIQNDLAFVPGSLSKDGYWGFWGNLKYLITDKSPITVLKQPFHVTVCFQEDRLQYIELIPIIDDEGLTDAEAEERRREVCDKWLSKYIGEPDSKIPLESVYSFSWGGIKSYSIMAGKYKNKGGRIVLTYK